MVSSVAAISQMIDEKDRYTSEHSHRVAETVRYYRENYDGTGYLEGLQGEAIPLLSRILAVADFTDRHRRRGETDAQIAAALRECAGHAFDPQCVEVMCGMLTEKT